jgi:dipeptidyl aminopeptidase/acylaminoacyl peptidase
MLPVVRAQDLPLINALSTPAVHPDGTGVVVACVRADFTADAYVGQLWLVPRDGSAPRRITRGFRDTAPAFSPDGALIGFLRAQAGQPPQLAIVAANGGEPMIITEAKLGVRTFHFSPDSSKIAYVAAVPQEGRYGTTEGVDAAGEDPRLITELQYKLNGVGYLADQRSQVFVVEVPDPAGEPRIAPVGRAAREGVKVSLVPEAKQLTSGDFDHCGLAWAEDSVIVISARHADRDRDLRADLYRFDPGATEPVRLTDSSTGASALACPVVVGDLVFFIGIDLGPDGLDVVGTNAGVYAVPTLGGAVRALTDAETVCIEGRLARSGDGVLAIDQVRGRGVAIKLDGSGELQRWDAPGSVTSVAAGGGTEVVTLATADSPGELVELGTPDRRLTDFGAELAASVIVPVEQLATAPDGYPVHGWMVRPAGDGPHPVVLVIHGGPFAAYSAAFFDEAQVLAGAGYAVLMCNPRGSAGYGQAHGRAIKGAMGDLDMVDVLAFLDHALATDAGLDASRVGVMGGSYGGYLAAWLTAHEQRFVAAIVERGFLDGRSSTGAADIGWYFQDEYQGDDLAKDAQSPLLLVDQVRTPTLVIHSEQDLRCPLSVAERYYTELKQRGVAAELLIFPGESHELSRSGTPHHRLARLQHILNWWDRYLRA